MNLSELKNYKIIVKKDAGECNLYSAENLQKYIEKTTGVKLEIVTCDKAVAPFFSIGETCQFKVATKDFDRSTLIHDGFRIFKDENDSIYFDSLSHRGVMYAVFDFIEKELGVRFLTARVEHIPTVSEIDLSKIDRVSIPDFPLGGYTAGELFGQKNAHCQIDYDFYAKMRSRELYTDIPEKLGGPLNVYGRNNSHNFSFYCPPLKWVDKHPEWYKWTAINLNVTPIIDLTNGITDDGELDESMEESVLKVCIEEMKKDIDAYPNVETFVFTQEDSSVEVTHERHAKLKAKYGSSGILIRFCNVLIREMNKYAMEKYNKTVKLMTFAYSYTRFAPVVKEGDKYVPIDDTVVCDDNLVIQFALFGNSYYDYFHEKQRPEIKEIIESWHAICNKFWFWGYDIDFAHFHYFFDSFHTINANMRGFKDMGIDYLFMEAGECNGIWQMKIKSYAYSKMMWDVSLDANALMDEFIDLYYGVCADKVREFIKLFHDTYTSIIEGGREVYFCMRTSSEDVENNPIEMLEGGLKLTDEMYELIEKANYSPELKKDMIRRIAEIRMTPLKMIYNKYYDYYPNNTVEQRLAMKEEFIKTAKLVDIPERIHMSGGGWRFFDQYIPEMDEIHGNYESGKTANSQHEAGYVPDDI